ncbi:GNAT family N-acetyltransferase [Streptomyces sp. I05A-00742]|uniref:GNAT family N-acetyltransferase n=1 Tax=Streptomyces sp. I05A-00742 TaxID=2732853 RepID=UPI001487CF1F|nr:GNAT family N-acetyltransferase [Streptomyces sp. I05A-00742]
MNEEALFPVPYVPFGVDLMMRPLRTADSAALADLRERVQIADDTGMHLDEEDVREELADAKLDMERDTVGVWQDARLVAYAVVHNPDRVRDVVRFETGAAVDPAWRRRGIGTELVRWMRARARVVCAEQHGKVDGELLLSGVATNAGLAALAESTGFVPCEHWFDMSYDLSVGTVRGSVPPPQGLRLVPFDEEHDEATRLAHNEAFRDHLDFAEADEAEWHSWGTGTRSFRKELSALLLDADGRVVAYLLAEESAADTAATGQRSCTVAFLGTLPAQRGRGAARALLIHTLDEARRRGYERAELVVDTTNATNALDLYRNVGFTVDREFVTYAGPLG